MSRLGKSKVIIQDIAGCGKFQVIITLCVFFLGNSSPAFTTMLMAFGNYNPGWKCIQQNSTMFMNISETGSTVLQKDNGTLSVGNNISSEMIETSSSSCRVFEACEHVEFNPESSTIVSEWGLVCSKKWIPSLIISIQMTGILVGGLFAGHLGDAIGRKVTIYWALLVLACLNVVCLFSSSWQMFAVLRFFLGVSSSCVMALYVVFTTEFVPNNWRSFLIGLPAWNVSSILFSIVCMYFKDWRRVQIVTIVIGAVGLIPALWIPESMRWLEVKNKVKKFENAAKKVTRTNGKTLPSLEHVGQMVNEDYDFQKNAKIFNIFHLFKKEYRRQTFLFTLPWFSMNLVNYALGFGVKALHGDFYLNLIIANFVDIPFAVLPMILPNLVGRKNSALIFGGATAICLLGASCLDRLAPDSVRGTGIVVLFFTAKVTIDALWCIMALLKVEIYPTVVRSLGVTWCLFMARIGGVVAPFLIPDDQDSVFISYTTMGILILVCFGFIIKLPETKGKQLQDTFEPEREEVTM